MAEIEDQKMKLANKMAEGTQAQGPKASAPSTNYQDYLTNGQWDDNKFANARGLSQSFLYDGTQNDQAFKDYEQLTNQWLYEGQGQAADAARAGSRISTGQVLQHNLDKEANQFASGAGDLKKESQNLLTRQADVTAGQAVRNVRKADNSRGLLYSNIRESNEAGAKGRVSSLLAQQIADSNSDIDKSLLSRQQAAVQAKLNQAEAAQQRQAEVDSIRQANSVARMQQMQQLAQIAGYAGGRIANDYRGGSDPSNGDRKDMGGRRYISSEGP